jgi:hypothetical protein
LITSNGFLPGWLEANETWCGECQSCVITTLVKALAIRLITGMTWSPSFIASLPPGRKQFCTSTTMRAVDPSGLILLAAIAFRPCPVRALASTRLASPRVTFRRCH